ncbi:hypothetical protein BCR35DRAFT_302392 [Leucosporidium creatinivorum]|uniref:F-box domain-containing protein n=1 Tax=Leucosporidium creatinivorum TaxID=106004 RepID=A0A1Y2FVF8_9BASI|nr:hypothetical protein BCR35DRAFT_302392 [Leucosporidium creatinivorum]
MSAVVSALPPELISAVLVHLIPGNDSEHFPHPSWDYTPLYNCCLLDRTWSECAQPLLHRKVYLAGDERLKQLKATWEVKPDLLKIHMREMGLVMEKQKDHASDIFVVMPVLPKVKRLTLGGWVELRNFGWGCAPAVRSLSLLASSTIIYADPILWKHITSLTLGERCPITTGITWPAPLPALPLPRFSKRLISLSITSPLPLYESPHYLAAFPDNFLANLKNLALEFAPRWAPSGPQANQLGMWRSSLLPRCTSLRTLRLSLITMTPWLSLLLRSCPPSVVELHIVLHPDEEQMKADLGISFSRLVLNDVGRLEKLKRFRVSDKHGAVIGKGVVSEGLNAELASRGCEVVEGGFGRRW